MIKKRILLSTFFLFSIITFVSAQNWLTDFEDAKALSTKTNNNIVLVFQGSDWCAPCIKLSKEVWDTDEFKAYASEHFVMLEADFPKKRQNKLSDEQQQKNNQLAEKYNRHGYFPFVVVLDKDGNVLGETSYKKMSVSEYIDLLSSY